MGEVRLKKRQEKEKRTDKKKQSIVSEKKNKSNEKKIKKSDKRRANRRGPQLAPSLQKEVNQMKSDKGSNDYEVSDFDDEETLAGDVYEYEEAAPEEESRKNRRYDAVDNYEYKLPDHFMVSFIILVHHLFYFLEISFSVPH